MSTRAHRSRASIYASVCLFWVASVRVAVNCRQQPAAAMVCSLSHSGRLGVMLMILMADGVVVVGWLTGSIDGDLTNRPAAASTVSDTHSSCTLAGQTNERTNDRRTRTRPQTMAYSTPPSIWLPHHAAHRKPTQRVPGSRVMAEAEIFTPSRSLLRNNRERSPDTSTYFFSNLSSASASSSLIWWHENSRRRCGCQLAHDACMFRQMAAIISCPFVRPTITTARKLPALVRPIAAATAAAAVVVLVRAQCK